MHIAGNRPRPQACTRPNAPGRWRRTHFTCTFALRILKLPVAWVSHLARPQPRLLSRPPKVEKKVSSPSTSTLDGEVSIRLAGWLVGWMDGWLPDWTDAAFVIEALALSLLPLGQRHLAAVRSRHTSNSFTCPRGSCGARTFFCACPATAWTWTWVLPSCLLFGPSAGWCSHFRKVGFQGRCYVAARCENSLQRCRPKCGHRHRLEYGPILSAIALCCGQYVGRISVYNLHGNCHVHIRCDPRCCRFNA